jgi:hypothetical protein
MESLAPRRLLQRDQAVAILSVNESDLQWLIDTRQLAEIRLRGHQLFDSRDIDQLIDTYKNLISRRKEPDEVFI